MKNKAIVIFFLTPFFCAYAMTEYGIMSAKNSYAENLKALVYNEASFKKQFNDYADFLKQVKEKDLYICNVLEQHFKQVFKQDCIELERVQNDLNAWQEPTKSASFLKKMNLILSSIACGGLSIGTGYLLFECIKNPTMGDGDGVMAAFLAVSSLASGLISTGLLLEGLGDYTKPMQAMQNKLTAIKERIKALNANYAYMVNNKDTLSNQ